MPDTTHPAHAALRAAAGRLADRFGDVRGRDAIDELLSDGYDRFAAIGAAPDSLPRLAERLADQRLSALARVEGHHRDGRAVVLFLCTHNAGRSQMAAGFLDHLAGDAAIAWSGGSAPGTRINPAAIAAMAERGIDITGGYPKPWTDEIVRAADVIVTMGCGDVCPVFPGRRYENWGLDDPAGLPVDGVRPIRDELERRVRHLVDELAAR